MERIDRPHTPTYDQLCLTERKVLDHESAAKLLSLIEATFCLGFDHPEERAAVEELFECSESFIGLDMDEIVEELFPPGMEDGMGPINAGAIHESRESVYKLLKQVLG